MAHTLPYLYIYHKEVFGDECGGADESEVSHTNRGCVYGDGHRPDSYAYTKAINFGIFSFLLGGNERCYLFDAGR